LHHDNASFHTSLFTREFLAKNKMTVVPYLPYISLFTRLKIKLKGRHFDTIEAIKAKPQAVLNTLTEPDFQDAFKNDISAGNGEYGRKGTASRVIVVRELKVSF
jgi:hypothetical protein